MDKLTNLFKVSKLLNFTESARVSTKLKSGVSNADTIEDQNLRSSIMSKYDSYYASKDSSVNRIQEVDKEFENLSKSASEKIKLEDGHHQRDFSSNNNKRSSCDLEVESQHHKFRNKIHNFDRRMTQFKRDAEERNLNYSRKSNIDFSDMVGYRTKTENFNITTEQNSKEFSLFEGTLNKHLRINEQNTTTEDTDHPRFPILSMSNKKSNLK